MEKEVKTTTTTEVVGVQTVNTTNDYPTPPTSPSPDTGHKIANHFKFHPVGQGLFYSGSLMGGEYNFVYDCGAGTDMDGKISRGITTYYKKYRDKAIQMYVDGLLSRGKPCLEETRKPYVDWVIISHLHKDHFNGLFELAKKAKIKKLYLPYLENNKELIKYILAYEILFTADRDELDTLRENPNDIVLKYKFYLKLYGIEGVALTKDENAQVRAMLPEAIKFVSDDMPDDERNFNYLNYWKFEIHPQPINVAIYDILLTKIKTRVRNFDQMLAQNSIDELVRNIDNIAEAHKEIFDDKRYRVNGKKIRFTMNKTSSILVHYPMVKALKAIVRTFIEPYWVNSYVLTPAFGVEHEDNKFTTVLTGDAEDFKCYKGLQKSIAENGVHFLQVPHHGSRDNWAKLEKSKIIKYPPLWYILPFGIGNTHKHPGISVLYDLESKGAQYFLTTQYSAFEYEIEVEVPNSTK